MAARPFKWPNYLIRHFDELSDKSVDEDRALGLSAVLAFPKALVNIIT